MPDLPDLLLNLLFDLVVLITAVVAWGLENKWYDQGTRPRRRWARAFLLLIIIGSISDGLLSWRGHAADFAREQRMERIDQGVNELVSLARERNPELSEQEALIEVIEELQILRATTNDLETEFEGLMRYGAVAELNLFGLSGRVGLGSGLRETSAISRILENAYERIESDGQVRWRARCDNESKEAFQDAAALNSDFPFAHWALAVCAFNEQNPLWRTHAQRAVTILEHTTEIAGHNTQHDDALTNLRGMLNE